MSNLVSKQVSLRSMWPCFSKLTDPEEEFPRTSNLQSFHPSTDNNLDISQEFKNWSKSLVGLQ